MPLRHSGPCAGELCALAIRARAGDAAALRKLIESEWPYLHSLASLVLRFTRYSGDADDAVSAGLAKGALRKLHSWDPERQCISSFLARAVVWAAKDMLKHKGADSGELDDNFSASGPSPAELAASSDVFAICFAKLSPREQSILLLDQYLPRYAIAAIFEIAEARVNQIIDAAKAKLRACLQSLEEP